jgi:hypothetical protein
MRTRDENWARLEAQRDEAHALLRGIDSVLIADVVLRAGFHPHHGPGLAILEVLVARHRGQHRAPLIPAIGHSDVVAVASGMGVEPHLEPMSLTQR